MDKASNQMMTLYHKLSVILQSSQYISDFDNNRGFRNNAPTNLSALVSSKLWSEMQLGHLEPLIPVVQKESWSVRSAFSRVMGSFWTNNPKINVRFILLIAERHSHCL